MSSCSVDARQLRQIHLRIKFLLPIRVQFDLFCWWRQSHQTLHLGAGAHPVTLSLFLSRLRFAQNATLGWGWALCVFWRLVTILQTKLFFRDSNFLASIASQVWYPSHMSVWTEWFPQKRIIWIPCPGFQGFLHLFSEGIVFQTLHRAPPQEEKC